MPVIIFHNPRCSKSRQTLQLLTDRGIKPVVVEYLKTPPGSKELRRILALLGKQPRDLMRKQEPVYKSLRLDNANLTDGQLIDAMVENPVLIERPIVLTDKKAALGRPPEQVLAIL